MIIELLNVKIKTINVTQTAITGGLDRISNKSSNFLFSIISTNSSISINYYLLKRNTFVKFRILFFFVIYFYLIYNI
jgi:hypothetical protein